MLNIAELEERVESAMQSAKVPGAALAIVHEHKVIYARGFGVTSIEDGGIPVTPQTIFRIGSTSKPLTTTAIMRLAEQGKLELDTTINEILPDLELSVPGAVNEITLRHLLSHTAALPTDAEHYGSRDASGLKAGVYNQVARYPLVAPVGKIWSYSNPGINLAGYIAELVSGKTFTEMMQELVFDPLEMKRTTFDPTVAMTYPLAQSHDLDAEGNLKVDHHYADNTMHYPAGFVMSTVLDLANFAIMQMNNGTFNGKQVLSPESVAEMQTPHARFQSLNEDGYGLTLSSFNYKGVRRIGHGGNISSFACHFEFIPETGTAVIMIVNQSALWGAQEPAISRFIIDSLLDLPTETEPIPTIEPDKTQWDRLVGIYTGTISGMAEVAKDGDALSLTWQGQTMPLNTVRDDLYVGQAEGGEPLLVGFTFEGETPADYANVLAAPGHSLALKRLAYDPNYRPNPAAAARLVGTYEHSLGDMTIRLDGDQLLVNSGIFKGAEFPAKMVDDTRLVLPIGLLTLASPDTLRLGTALDFTRRAEQ